MAEGWIKVHRNMLNHWIWSEKPYSRGQAWVDLLLMVNHVAGVVMLEGEAYQIDRGETLISETKLASRWGWSRSKTSRFLHVLVSDQMVSTKRVHRGTVLKVLRYSDWQETRAADEPQKSRRRAADEPQTNTNKNVKNEKNEKKDIRHTSWDHPEAVAHGPYVRLLPSEFDAMVSELGESRTSDLILRLNGYIEQIGEPAARKRYKSHKATMMNWHRMDVEKGIYRKKEVPNDGYAQWT